MENDISEQKLVKTKKTKRKPQSSRKTVYKSDVFEFIHPSGHIRCPSYFNKDKFFDESVANSKLIEPDQSVQIKAFTANVDGRGGIIVFPKQKSTEAKTSFYTMIQKTLSDITERLKDECKGLDEHFDFYTVVMPPSSVFKASFSNRESGETFNDNSIVVQFSGLGSTTFDYVTEEIHAALSAEIPRFNRQNEDFGITFSTVLVKNLNTNKFYEFGPNEDSIYLKPFTNRHTRETIEYTLGNFDRVD